MKKDRKQANQYDKIFKENIEAVIPSLMQNVLGITAVFMEELPDDVQHTKERKPDVLKKVTDSQGNTFVLHIEFQVANEPEMVYRMAEYYVMLARKYKLPVQQYVIFLGKNKLKMASELQSVNLSFRYNLLEIKTISYKTFLKSNQPEEVVLSILAHFDKDTSENVLKKIIQRIEETTDGEFSFKKYFNQLRILSQLRKLEQNLKDIIMDSIAKYIDQKRDVGYLIGQDKAREEEQTKFVTNLLEKLSLTVEQIADIAGVSIEFVNNIQQKLSANK
jgi:predicted transposase YdaD